MLDFAMLDAFLRRTLGALGILEIVALVLLRRSLHRSLRLHRLRLFLRPSPAGDGPPGVGAPAPRRGGCCERSPRHPGPSLAIWAHRQALPPGLPPDVSGGLPEGGVYLQKRNVKTFLLLHAASRYSRAPPGR